MVDEVAGGEHARAVGAGRAALGSHVALLIDGDLPVDELGLGLVADRDERARDGDVALLAGLGVDEARVPERAVLAGDELAHGERGQQLDVLLRAGPLEHDLRRSEVGAPVDDRDLAGELGEEDRLLHRRVSAADDQRLAAAEEGGVAGRAVADAAAGELVLAGNAEFLVLGSHRQHDGPRAVLGVADPHAVQAAGLAGELDAIGLLGQQARAEALGLLAELQHDVRPHDALGEAGKVLDVGRLLQQPAPGEALDHERVEVGASGVQSRRVPSRSAADDDHVLDVAHLNSWLFQRALYFV